MTTAGGVAFLTSALDVLHPCATTSRAGGNCGRIALPAGGQATPMSYQGADGRQYVVAVAGGHGTLGTKTGDHVIAYALPDAART